MELGSDSDYYFITTFRDGEVVKVQNVAQGKPTLKFKTMREVYGLERAESSDSLTESSENAGLHLISTFRDGKAVKVENVTRGRPALKFKSIREVYGYEGVEANDSLTEECEKTCKTKKREAARIVISLYKENHATHPIAKQLFVEQHTDKDEYDLEEDPECLQFTRSDGSSSPLFSEESKCSSVMKVFGKVPEEDGGFAGSMPLPEETYDGCKLNQISYHHLDEEFLPDYGSPVCSLQGVSLQELTYGVTETDNGSTSKLESSCEASKGCSEMPLLGETYDGCKLNQISYHHLDDEFSPDYGSPVCSLQGVSLQEPTYGVMETDNGSTSKLESLPSCEASKGCSFTETSGDLPCTADCWMQSLNPFSPEGTEGRGLKISCKHIDDDNVSSVRGNQRVFLEDVRDGVMNIKNGSLSEPELLSVSSATEVHSPAEVCGEVTETGNCCLQKLDSSSNLQQTEGCKLEVVIEHLEDSETSSTLAGSLKSEEFVRSDDLKVIDDKLLDVPIYDHVTSEKSPERTVVHDTTAVDYSHKQGIPTQSKKSTDLRAPFVQIGEFRNHAPERLLSARKIIFPTSQKRLRELVNSDELLKDSKTHNHSKKLCHEDRGHNAASIAKSDLVRKEDNITPRTPEAMTTKNTGKAIAERKKQIKFFRPKSSTDGPQSSEALPRLKIGCNTIQGCCKNAIAFSKQQMFVTNQVAAKLSEQLQSMVGIVVETLHSGARVPSRPSNTSEVEVAVRNVRKAEKTCRGWLSSMQRDCDRFCKIMSLAENDASCQESTTQVESPEKEAASPGSTVPNKRKVHFADEAGGKLCDVGFYSKGSISASGTAVDVEKLEVGYTSPEACDGDVFTGAPYQPRKKTRSSGTDGPSDANSSSDHLCNTSRGDELTSSYTSGGGSLATLEAAERFLLQGHQQPRSSKILTEVRSQN